MESWEYADIIERKRGTPLSPLEKSIAEQMNQPEDIPADVARYLGLEW